MASRLNSKSRLAAFLGLSGANAAAALINVAVLPYIARLVDPHQFGLSAAVLLVSALCATAVSGRYEVGAAVADHSAIGNTESFQLARLAVGLTLLSALVLQLGIETWAQFGSSGDHLSTWRWLPLLTLTTACTSIQTLLDTRTARYSVLACLIVARPIVLVIAVWAASSLGTSVTAGPLCAAYVVSAIPSTMRAIWLTGRRSGQARPSMSQYAAIAKKHSKLPRLQVPAALLNALSGSLLGLTVTWSFGPAALGAFSMATRLTYLPSTVAGGPINTLYLREAVLAKDDSRVSKRYYLIALIGSVAVGLCAIPVLAMLSPHLDLVLGPAWSSIDAYVFATIPLMGALLISAPANSALMTHERQRALLGWRILLVACPAIGLILTGSAGASPAIGIAVGSCIALVVSCAYAAFGLKAVARPRESGG